MSAADDEPDDCFDGVPAAVRRKGKMVRKIQDPQIGEYF
jgi:hypothetical protein